MKLAISFSSHWLLLMQIMIMMSTKLPSRKVGARETHLVKQNTQENSNNPFGTKQPGLGRNLRLAVLQAKLDLGWISLHGCKL